MTTLTVRRCRYLLVVVWSKCLVSMKECIKYKKFAPAICKFYGFDAATITNDTSLEFARACFLSTNDHGVLGYFHPVLFSAITWHKVHHSHKLVIKKAKETRKELDLRGNMMVEGGSSKLGIMGKWIPTR